MNFSKRSHSPIARPAEFQAAYEHHRLSVYRYIYSITGGPQAHVEDLAAETFLRAWRARHRYHGEPERAIAWLIQIAKRLVIDEYRRSQRAASHQSPPLPTTELPEDTALHNEDIRRLTELLVALPTEQREILTLRYSLDWQVKDIAAHMEMTENNVSVVIHRTLAKLRQQWPSKTLSDGESNDETN